MQPTQILSILAFAPFLALANPVQIDRSHELVRRGGIDFCGSVRQALNGACTEDSGDLGAHACDKDNDRRVLVCNAVGNGRKWQVERTCSEKCRCDKGTPLRGNLVCK
ncbi:unnamed protein product [Periconia digitata]|uniref:Uncharacterized protein n=1 Tax=Periconia digitata TaxID=1303443 RepID=A0A9W4XXJ7_9PLEO|nr:unnamed protein product [Periconia digitata]